MIVVKEFPDKKFESKDELHRYLVDNQKELIDLKTNALYKSFEKGQSCFSTNKMEVEEVKKVGIEAKKGYIYPIVSTTKYLDSHSDVHFDGCFNKTVKDQQGKVKYILDHQLKWDSVLVWQKDVKMFVKSIPWSYVGKNYSGETEALIFEIKEENFKRKDVLQAIKENKEDFENSISMFYVKIKLGINSENPDFKDQKEYFDRRYNEIANKEKLDELGYFWGVEELGIYKEASLVVAGGSNDATRIYFEQESKPSEDTSNNNEPSKDTQKAKELLKELLTKI